MSMKSVLVFALILLTCALWITFWFAVRTTTNVLTEGHLWVKNAGMYRSGLTVPSTPTSPFKTGDVLVKVGPDEWVLTTVDSASVRVVALDTLYVVVLRQRGTSANTVVRGVER